MRPTRLDRSLPRVVHAEDLAGYTAVQLMDVMRTFMAILALPQSAAEHVDALVIPIGQGEEWRLTHAIRRWETNPEIVEALGITSLALTVSPYHLPRVYLTVLKALSRSGIRVPLIPDPVPVSPDTAAPETQATAYDLLPGEAERILRYMNKGWVATFEELQRYLQWLWSDHKALLTKTRA